MIILCEILIFFCADVIKKNVEVYKDYKPKKISKVCLPLELTREYDEVEINTEIENKYNEILENFSKVMREKFPKEDLTNFYNNINELKIKSLKIKEGKLYSFLSRLAYVTPGQYNTKKNLISISDKYLNCLYHELFHMASSINCNQLYSGFRQKNFGYGLNEGYTDLLTRRYFNQKEGYVYHVPIAEKVEQIVGMDRMQSLYLNCNLR